MTSSVLPLLQRYLDMTGDVQTVSLLAIRTLSQEVQANNILKFWIERYRWVVVILLILRQKQFIQRFNYDAQGSFEFLEVVGIKSRV